MMDEMIKKTRSDHRADARHGNTSSDTYSGVQLKNFLVNLDVPDSVNYEVAPRGCQTCLLRSFGQMVGEAWENSRLDPSMFPACQPSVFANFFAANHEAYWPCTPEELDDFIAEYPDYGTAADWEERQADIDARAQGLPGYSGSEDDPDSDLDSDGN